MRPFRPITGYRAGAMAARSNATRPLSSLGEAYKRAWAPVMEMRRGRHLLDLAAFNAAADALDLNFTHDPRPPAADPPGWRERYVQKLAALFAPKGSNLAHAFVQLGQGVLKALVRKVTQAARRRGRDKAFRLSADIFHDEPDAVMLGDQDGQAGDQDGVLCGQARRDLDIIHIRSSFRGCGDLKEARPVESREGRLGGAMSGTGQ